MRLIAVSGARSLILPTKTVMIGPAAPVTGVVGAFAFAAGKFGFKDGI